MELSPLNDTIFGVAVVKQSRSTVLFTPEEKINCLFEAVAVGPDCKEMKVGDYGVVESLSGTMVTLYDEETDELVRYYTIRERNVLARYAKD